MNVIDTAIPDVKLIEPRLFGDERGFFMETWRETWAQAVGVTGSFVQDNHSRSAKGVLRGLHYQLRQPQGKLVRVIAGSVFDVAVDMRRSSATFGQWVGYELSAENRRMIWVPPGFAHGFLTLSDTAEFIYKCTDYYLPEWERTLRWDDTQVGVDWPIDPDAGVVLSAKDETGAPFAQAEVFP